MMSRGQGLMVLVVLLWVAGSGGGQGVDSAEPLPEGDNGIAARHLRDWRIERNRAVVFADGFESAGKRPGGRWDGTWTTGGVVETAQQKGCVYSGRKAALIGMLRENPAKEDGAGMHKRFRRGYDELFLRYYAKFDKNSEFYHGGAHNGVGMHATAPGVRDATPGTKANGRNKFTVLLDTYRQSKEVASPGPQVVYVYHPEQRQNFGEQWYPSGLITPPGKMGKVMFGQEFVSRPNFIPERDRWYCYELMVKANKVGKRDGRIAFWVDGRLTGDFPNLRLRDVDSLKINRITLQMSSMNQNANKPVAMWFDNVIVARSYIGPMFTGKPASDKPKKKLVPPAGW